MDRACREKSLTGSMYGSSEPHAMTEPLLDYLAGIHSIVHVPIGAHSVRFLGHART